MKVTSAPSAVYTSENSSPMYPDPTMAAYSGTKARSNASSDVKTVFPSACTVVVPWLNTVVDLAVHITMVASSGAGRRFQHVQQKSPLDTAEDD